MLKELYLILQPFNDHVHHTFIECGGVGDIGMVFLHGELPDNDSFERISKLDVFLDGIFYKIDSFLQYKLVKTVFVFYDVVRKGRQQKVVLQFDDRPQGRILEVLITAHIFGKYCGGDDGTDGQEILGSIAHKNGFDKDRE
jgi:hypothetical protein